VDPADRDKLRPPPLPPEPPPPADDNLIAAGKRAFAARQYGRAAERLRRAVAEAPADAEARLLLAQTYFALGKYAEATAAAHAGVRLRPDWPTQAFVARELSPDRPAEFDDQLARLADALKRTPDDPALQFLFGYQLWFADRKAEAELYFRRARRRASDPEVIDRFLMQVNDGMIVRTARAK
jgi:tetratricopeptide (TPR) repeat protein